MEKTAHYQLLVEMEGVWLGFRDVAGCAGWGAFSSGMRRPEIERDASSLCVERMSESLMAHCVLELIRQQQYR